MDHDAALKLHSDDCSQRQFIEDVIDGMFDWVRVLDRNDNIIYANKTMSENLKNYSTGRKCYEVLGRKEPCKNCTSRKSVFDGTPHEKEEIIDGRIYSVMSSPVRSKTGEIDAVVEVLRDITEVKYLQNKILEQNKKLQEDLKMAKKLQCSLLPKSQPDDKVKFSFIYKPCESLGGDFLDIFRIDDEHIGIYIADVSGHGVSASMLTVFLRSVMNKKILSPAAALEELYKEFNSNSFDVESYITVFYAVIDLKSKTITYSNAGHNVSPFIFNRNRFEIMRVPGIPISNWLACPGYTDRKTSLQSGDRVFLYTDGIIEIRNKQQEQYGEERLLDILLHETASPNGILNNIIDSACKFAGIEDPLDIPDDVTMALLELA